MYSEVVVGGYVDGGMSKFSRGGVKYLYISQMILTVTDY